MNIRVSSFAIFVLAGLLPTAIIAETKTIPGAVVRPAIQPQATNPSYLSQMPSVDRVKAEAKGTDPTDTAARQVATFRQLCAIILDMAIARIPATEGLLRKTSDEDRITADYGAAYTRIWQGRPELLPAVDRYERDPKFRDDLLTKFFSPEFRAIFYKATGKQPPQTQGAPVNAQTSAAFNYLEQGHKYYEAKEYLKAIDAYKKAIALKPDTQVLAAAHWLLGQSYNELERYEEAIPALRDALRLKPDDAVASRDLGNAYYSLKQYPDAALAYKQAIRLKPDYADAHYWLGLTYFEMGKKDEALQIYRKLLTIDREQAQKLYAEITKAR